MDEKCIIHYKTVSETELCSISEKNKSKLSECSARRQSLQFDNSLENEVNIAGNIDEIPDLAGYKFHKKCYSHFTDKTRIEAAIKRQTKNAGTSEEYWKRQKFPRRETARESNLFKTECIFCHSEKKIMDPLTRKRQYENLTKCMSINAEKNIKSQAAKKNDFHLIGLIADQDLIAREAMYHKSCYRSYLYNPRVHIRGKRHLYKKSWEHFKSYVEEKLGSENKCMTLMNLLEEFKKIVLTIEKLDASSYTTSSLKLRLQKEFPHIQFHKKGTSRNAPEIASMASDSSQLYAFTYSSSSEYITSNDDEAETNEQNITDPNMNNNHELYYAAKYLAQKIEAAPSLDSPWPPIAEHLNETTALHMIPIDLIKFLSWLFGETDPLFASFSEDSNKKILSIAQDIIYLFTSGVRHTPKHLSLAVAVRHITGSAEIVKILNGFGHCISYSKL